MWRIALLCVASQCGPRVVAKKSQLDFNAEESRKILSKYFGKLDAESYDRLGPSIAVHRSAAPVYRADSATHDEETRLRVHGDEAVVGRRRRVLNY